MDISVRVNLSFQTLTRGLVTSWHDRDQPPETCDYIHCGLPFEESDTYTVIEIKDDTSGKVAFVHGECAIRLMDQLVDAI